MKYAAPLRALIASGLLAFVVAGAVLTWQWGTRPRFLSAEFSADGVQWTPFSQPLWLWDETPEATVLVTFAEPAFESSLYSIRANGHSESLTVNSHTILPGEDAGVFAIGKYLMGRNVLQMRIRNVSSQFSFLSWSMTAATGDPLCLRILVFLCALSMMVAYGCIRWIGASRSTAAVLTFGIGLRLMYVLSTPEWVRAYDWEGHHEYVLYMLKFWAIPPATLGWETYQPPLFYVLAALVKTALTAVGFDAYEALQVLPLWIAAGVLLTAWRLSRILWTEGSAKQSLFLLIVAAFPGLVFQSSQISNDGLFTLFGALWLLCMIRFQTTRRFREWILASVIVTAAFLTKNNALVLAAAQIASLAVFRLSLRRTAACLGSFGAIVLLGAGWLFCLRFFIEGQTNIIGNLSGLPAVLNVPNTPRALLSFNPLETLRVPFVNDIEDWSRRRYFWEYVFKSSLFGSHVFPSLLDVCRTLVISAFALFGLAVIGCIRTFRSERTRLLLVVSASFVGAVFCYRLLYPMSPNQHFRFIAPVALPFAVFAVSWQPKKRWLAQVSECVIAAFSVLAFLFFWLIAAGSL